MKLIRPGEILYVLDDEEQTAMDKMIIKEAIIVEGRDDTAAINRAVSALTIETHGFWYAGINVGNHKEGI